MGQYDIALRHLVQRHARDLVGGLVPSLSIDAASWVETQLTTLERRMDRALELRSNGDRRFLHLEVIAEPEGNLSWRMYEYGSLTTIAQRTAPEQGKRGAVEVAPIKSVALLLSGRAKPWPLYGELRTSWPEPEPFSGYRYQIEPVYQRTVEQLLARPGVFWLVFAPLAVNATAAAMRRVLEEIRRREPVPGERAELYTAMLVVAELNTWGHNLREEIKMMLQNVEREALMQFQTFREWFEEGMEKGIEKGRKEGIEKGRKEGIEKGRKEGIEEMLQALFLRRVQRELTPVEKEALSSRAATLDAAQMTAVIDLPADALMTWLMGPDAE